MTVRDILEILLREDAYADLRNRALIGNLTVGQMISMLLQMEGLDDALSTPAGLGITFGDALDFLASDPEAQKYRDEEIDFTVNMGDVLDIFGRKETKALINKKLSESMYDPDYAYTKINIIGSWVHLVLFVIAFPCCQSLLWNLKTGTSAETAKACRRCTVSKPAAAA